MKKIKISSVEILGLIGLIIWAIVIILRSVHIPDNSTLQFIIGILPNLGAIWAATMFGKWCYSLATGQRYTIRMHCTICLVVFCLACGSEVIHAVFYNSPFDIYDVLITIAALFIMLFIPIITKDKNFKA